MERTVPSALVLVSCRPANAPGTARPITKGRRKTREGAWDSARVGAGAAPIKTAKGWLSIYHGANEKHQYCLGAFLMDLNDPSKIIARSDVPIMVPTATYETSGFFGNVVFTNGHIIHPDGDTITVYYGAADEFVCGAHFSLQEIFSLLKFNHA